MSTCEELRRCLAETPGDSARADALAAQVGRLRTQQLCRLVKSIAEVRGTLTPKQRELLENFEF